MNCGLGYLNDTLKLCKCAFYTPISHNHFFQYLQHLNQFQLSLAQNEFKPGKISIVSYSAPQLSPVTSLYFGSIQVFFFCGVN